MNGLSQIFKLAFSSEIPTLVFELCYKKTNRSNHFCHTCCKTSLLVPSNTALWSSFFTLTVRIGSDKKNVEIVWSIFAAVISRKSVSGIRSSISLIFSCQFRKLLKHQKLQARFHLRNMLLMCSDPHFPTNV